MKAGAAGKHEPHPQSEGHELGLPFPGLQEGRDDVPAMESTSPGNAGEGAAVDDGTSRPKVGTCSKILIGSGSSCSGERPPGGATAAS